MRDALRWRLAVWRWSWRTGLDRACLAIARRLPRRLVYWCAIRLGAEATTGRYGSTEVPSLAFMDALRRWESGR